MDMTKTEGKKATKSTITPRLMTPRIPMNLYENYCLPCLLNLACGVRAISKVRAEVVPLARGRVLEVGIGGGLNLSYYDPDKVSCVCGIEPSEGMRKKAEKAVKTSSIPVEILPVTAEGIPLEDDSIDTVLLTFTLCTIPDWRSALAQMRRVLKPQGKLVFCEHGLAPENVARVWQRRINPYWKVLAGGCNLDRAIPDLIRDAGFTIEIIKSEYVAGMPRFAGYVYRGTACKC